MRLRTIIKLVILSGFVGLLMVIFGISPSGFWEGVGRFFRWLWEAANQSPRLGADLYCHRRRHRCADLFVAPLLKGPQATRKICRGLDCVTPLAGVLRRNKVKRSTLNNMENGAAGRIRTADPRITNALLYHLSYCGNQKKDVIINLSGLWQ